MSATHSETVARSPVSVTRRLPHLVFLALAGVILLSCAGCCVVLVLADDAQTTSSAFSLGTLLFCFASLAIPTLAALYLLFVTPEAIRPQQVIDRWGNLVDGGHGHRQQVIDALHRSLVALDPPQTLADERMLASGRIFGGSGERRPFVVVSHSGNFRLEPYRIYVSVRDYGNALQTSWYLVAKPTFWQALLQRVGLLSLDFFEEEDLRGYVTAVHHCFIQAVVELLTTLGQDDDRLDRTSKGFLGVS